MYETVTSHPVVCFGETLWDILPHAKLPGGAPMNVAYHLKKLGKNPALISRVGNDALGKELLQVCLAKNINTGLFQVDEDYPTGKVFAEMGSDNEVHYDIVKPSAWDHIQWQDDFIPLIRQASYFVFGSLVNRNDRSAETLSRCLEAANTKVLDINMRPPHYNKQVLGELLGKADILKMNVAELHLVTGWYKDYATDEDRIQSLKERFDIDTIIVTKGGEGAVFYSGNSYLYHDGYKVTVADTVGSGDSFLAAILAEMIDRSPPPEMLGFACAMGAFVASCPGGCPDYEVDQVRSLMKSSNQPIITV